MKTNYFHQQITDTLESCLGKMAEKLKTNFDPQDKNSLKLLQNFRSTLATWRTWMKQSVQKIETSMNKMKESVKSSFKNKKHEKQEKTNDIQYKAKPNPERDRLMALMNQPSGLYYTPTKT